MSTIDQAVIKRTVKNLILSGRDYREEIIKGIDEQFLQHALDFFKKIVVAKADDKTITADWYKELFIEGEEEKASIALNAGINMKTISNIHGTGRKEVVLDAALHHYDSLKALIDELADQDGKGLDFFITIKMGRASAELNINESLIVINALAVKRAAMRGGAWSSIGKRAEKMLMQTLCTLYSVDGQYWDAKQTKADGKATYEREIDFFLISNNDRHKCEVKLMGKGNPESADAVIARESKVFVADTLSETNKKQLESLGVLWVALKEENGYQRFADVLKGLNIPHKPPASKNLEKRLDEILEGIGG